MCTIGRTTVKAAGEAHHRPDAEECTVRYGVNREERIAAPSGAVILF